MSAQDRRSNIADFRLSVDGQDFSDKARPRLISLTITEKRGEEADDFTLVLDDSDGRLALPRKGAKVRVQLGWVQGADVTIGLVDKGSFIIDQVSWSGPPDRITLRGRSADLTAGFRRRREATHKDTTIGAIAREIAARHGLEPKISPDLADIAVPILVQHHKSDMQLLRQLGREHDAVATVKDGKLLLAPIGKGASVTGKPLPVLELRKSDLSPPYSYSESERSADAGVEARHIDQDAAERKTVKVGGGDDAKGDPRRLRRVYHSEEKARQAAEAASKRARRDEVAFDVSLGLGRLDVVPEQPVKLTGLKPEIDGRSWMIAEIAHAHGKDGGLVTKIKLEIAS